MIALLPVIVLPFCEAANSVAAVAGFFGGTVSDLARSSSISLRALVLVAFASCAGDATFFFFTTGFLTTFFFFGLATAFFFFTGVFFDAVFFVAVVFFVVFFVVVLAAAVAYARAEFFVLFNRTVFEAIYARWKRGSALYALDKLARLKLADRAVAPAIRVNAPVMMESMSCRRVC